MKTAIPVLFLIFVFLFGCGESDVTILGPDGDSDAFEKAEDIEFPIWTNPGDEDSERVEENILESDEEKIIENADDENAENEESGVADETLLNTCTNDENCSYGFCWKRQGTDVKGICVKEPSQDAELYRENSYYDYDDRKKKGSYDQVLQDDEPVEPDFSCSSAGLVDDFNETATVDLAARVKVFNVSAPCTALFIEIHNQNDENGEIKTSYPTDESLIAPVPVTGATNDRGECPVTIEGVPVNRWLVFKSYDEGNVDFHDTFQFNIYIPKADVSVDESYDIEISAFADSSWKLIPATAGITQGVRGDRSIAMGTVQDCGGRLVKNATVAISVKVTKTSYFNANVSNLVPMNTLINTNSDGTFAFIDAPPGLPEGTKVRFVTLAKVNGEISVVNSYDVMLFPSSVTILGMNGGQTMNFGHLESLKSYPD